MILTGFTIYELVDSIYRITDPEEDRTDYIRDTANLSVLCAGIWQALGEVIGDEETER